MLYQRHPLGLHKFNLVRMFGYKIKLHLWIPDSSALPEDVHDHVRSFISIPLLGIFREKRYKKVDGSKALYACYQENRKGRRVDKIGEGVAALQVSSRYRFFPLPYYCHYTVLHGIEPIWKIPFVTLVIGLPQRKEFAEVIK